MTDFRIQTTGLKELNDGLRFFENGVAKSVRPILKAFAERVAGKVRQAYGRRYPTAQHVNAGGVRSAATNRSAQLILGGERAPFLLGQEFGSDKFRQFPAWSGNTDGAANGYYFFPTLRRELPDMTGELAQMVDEYAAKAFPVGGIARARRR